mmetsp:Transcript_4577/g.6946  ORF Transcript_4577/g.6946 Transcript_4577/m.6946 type:complete len:100 (+) Transcript_4577:2767-3066(+)
MEEILPSIDPEDYLDLLKKSDKPQDHLKQVLEGAMVYQEKHYQRAERLLRASYYVDYVVSQMTLDEQPAVGSKRALVAAPTEEEIVGKKKSKKSKKSKK